MKVKTPKQTSLISGSQDSCEMTLTESGLAQATRLLRDQIYTYKDWAAVRETIANAIDEHRKHNVEKPIVVTVPTQNDPFFRVRDYGLGLDKKGVFSVFFQYFASSKNHSNEAIGGFGIGAKAPLSYSDSFFVTSFNGGKKTVYCATLDGITSKAYEMSQEESAEPTGIEVSVPVRQCDFNNFNKFIGYFCSMAQFDNFKFEGTEPSDYSKSLRPVFENSTGSLCSLTEILPLLEDGSIVVRDGDILYPVPQHDQLTPPKSGVMILNVERGKLDIAPSRESIDLSRKSLGTISRLSREFMQAAKTKFLATIDSAKSIKEKRVAFKRLHEQGIASTLGLKQFPSWEVSKKITFLITIHGDNSVERKKAVPRYHWYDTVNLEPERHDIVLLPEGKTVSTNKVLAFYKSVKKTLPVYIHIIRPNPGVGQLANVPAGWMEGEDYLIFDEKKIKPTVAKSIKDTFFLKGSSTAQKKGSFSKTTRVGKVGGWESSLAEIEQRVKNGEKCLYIHQAETVYPSPEKIFNEIFPDDNYFVIKTYKKYIPALESVGAASYKAWFKANSPNIKKKVETALQESSYFVFLGCHRASGYDAAGCGWLPELASRLVGSQLLEIKGQFHSLEMVSVARQLFSEKEMEDMGKKITAKNNKWQAAKEKFLALPLIKRELLYVFNLNVTNHSWHSFDSRPEALCKVGMKIAKKIFDV
jgi:hypothetical protein